MNDPIQQGRKLLPNRRKNRFCIMMLIGCMVLGMWAPVEASAMSVAAQIDAHHESAAPARKDRAYYEGRGDIVWEVPSAGKRIAFTFDDGPDPVRTPVILDLLKQYNAKATFFVIGWRVKQNEALVKRTAREGHEIANHTYHHKYFRKGVTKAEIEEEMMKAHQVIEEVAGTTPRLFRPPGGYYNEQLVQIARENGYRVILWSWHQDTKDWRSPGVERIVNKVIGHARNGDIVLMHDFVDGSTQTIQALKKILPELKRRGYSFVTVSELMAHRVKAKTS